MASLYDTMVADLKSIEAQMDSQVITWNGTDYLCIPNTANESRELGAGGFNLGADLIVDVRVELFENGIIPQSEQKITYLTKDYRIEKVGYVAMGVYLRMHCVNVTKGV